MLAELLAYIQKAHQQDPPFEGAEFDEQKHRWVKPDGVPIKDTSHPKKFSPSPMGLGVHVDQFKRTTGKEFDTVAASLTEIGQKYLTQNSSEAGAAFINKVGDQYTSGDATAFSKIVDIVEHPEKLSDEEQKALLSIQHLSRMLIQNAPIIMYRGVSDQDIKDGKLEVDKLSSWTTDPNVAKEFAGSDGKVTSMEVSPKQIVMATVFLTSPNVDQYKYQKEFIIYSKVPMVDIMEKAHQSTPPFEGAEFDETKHRWIQPDKGETGEHGGTFKLPADDRIQIALKFWKMESMPTFKDISNKYNEARDSINKLLDKEAKEKGVKYYFDDPELKAKGAKLFTNNNQAAAILSVMHNPKLAQSYINDVNEADGHIVSCNKLEKKYGISGFIGARIADYGQLGGSGEDFVGWPGSANDSAIWKKRPQPEQEHFDKMPAKALWEDLENILQETKRNRLPVDLATRRYRVMTAIRKNQYHMTDDEISALRSQNSDVGGWFSSPSGGTADIKRAAYYVLQGMEKKAAAGKAIDDYQKMSRYNVSPENKAEMSKRVLESLSDEHISALKKNHTLITDYLRKKHGDTITIYRGIVNEAAHKLKEHAGKEVEVDVTPPSSFSMNLATAKGYAKSSPVKKKDKYPNGVVLETTVPVENVWVHGDLDAPQKWFTREQEFATVINKPVLVKEVL